MSCDCLSLPVLQPLLRKSSGRDQRELVRLQLISGVCTVRSVVLRRAALVTECNNPDVETLETVYPHSGRAALMRRGCVYCYGHQPPHLFGDFMHWDNLDMRRALTVLFSCETRVWRKQLLQLPSLQVQLKSARWPIGAFVRHISPVRRPLGLFQTHCSSFRKHCQPFMERHKAKLVFHRCLKKD